MTGINDINKVGQVRPLTTGTQDQVNRGADGDLFQKTFERILSENSETTAASVSPAATGLAEISASAFNLRIEDESVGAVEKNTEQLLTLMEQYARDLGDPNKTLRDIEPLVQGIKEGADLLSESVKNDTAASDRIKTLAEESAVLANVEYMKFMRGDYA